MKKGEKKQDKKVVEELKKESLSFCPCLSAYLSVTLYVCPSVCLSLPACLSVSLRP